MDDKIKLKPLYLYISRSNAILDEKIADIKKYLTGKINLETDFKIFDTAGDINSTECINFLNTPSFFSNRKACVIKNINQIKRNKKINKNFIKELIDSIKKIESSDDTILIMTSVDKKVNPEVIRSVKESGVMRELRTPSSIDTKKWLKERSELDGITFSQKTINLLVDNVNSDYSQVKKEYEKISVYMLSEKEKTVTEDLVNNLAIKLYDAKVFDVVDQIGMKLKEDALQSFEILYREDSRLEGLISLLHKMFRCILFLKVEKDKDKRKDFIAGNINIRNAYFLGSVSKKYARFSEKYSISQIIRVFNLLNDFDMAYRTSSISPKLLFRKLIVNIIEG